MISGLQKGTKMTKTEMLEHSEKLFFNCDETRSPRSHNSRLFSDSRIKDRFALGKTLGAKRHVFQFDFFSNFNAYLSGQLEGAATGVTTPSVWVTQTCVFCGFLALLQLPHPGLALPEARRLAQVRRGVGRTGP